MPMHDVREKKKERANSSFHYRRLEEEGKSFSMREEEQQTRGKWKERRDTAEELEVS